MLAFILAKVDSGKDREVLKQINKLPETKRAYPTYGIYDLIVEVKYDSSKKLDSFVFDKLRAVSGIRETATLICSEMLIWELGLEE